VIDECETDRPPLDLGAPAFHERREVASVFAEFLLKEIAMLRKRRGRVSINGGTRNCIASPDNIGGTLLELTNAPYVVEHGGNDAEGFGRQAPPEHFHCKSVVAEAHQATDGRRKRSSV
jgi:hypothetical protein